MAATSQRKRSYWAARRGRGRPARALRGEMNGIGGWVLDAHSHDTPHFRADVSSLAPEFGAAASQALSVVSCTGSAIATLWLFP